VVTSRIKIERSSITQISMVICVWFCRTKDGKNSLYLIPRVNTQWLNLVLKTLTAFEEATAEKGVAEYRYD
jgi:hypothetical protein